MLRLRFSLRTFFIAITILAIVMAFIISARERERRIESLNRLGVSITYAYQIERTGQLASDPPGPKWLRWILGEHFFTEPWTVGISGNCTDTSTAFNLLGKMTSMRSVFLKKNLAPAAVELEKLKLLPRLERLFAYD